MAIQYCFEVTQDVARWDRLLGEAERLLPHYLEATRELPHAKKGIRRSELFFFYALVAPLNPARIIDSGRARAQSTLVLSRLFPRTPIVSLESDPDSPDVAVAAERLRECANVECRFGDSRRMLPQLVQANDVVLIDGPKDFRALKLALRLLVDEKAGAVFVHDLWPGSPARQFLDRHLQFALLSDEPRWVERYASLDAKRSPPPARPGVRRAYGPTFGYLAGGLGGYRLCLFHCRIAQARDRIEATTRKLLHRPPPVRPKDFEEVTA